MSSSSPPRIRIEDLPAIENLSVEEMEEIFGAGRARRRGFTGDAPQMLEVRQMLSATLNIGIDYGTLRVEGTNQSDNLFIRQENNTVTIENFAANGGMERIQITDPIQRIDISTGGGDDFIHLAGVNVQGGVTLDGGDGADLLVVDSRTDAGLSTQVATLATTVKTEDAVLAQGTSLEQGMGAIVETRMDSQGNTFRLTYLNGRLREAEISNTTGGVSRIRWAEDDTVVRDTFQDGQQTLQEVWSTNGGYLRTEWREDKSLIRESFVNGRQLTREEWRGDSFVRTAWKENGDQLRQTFSGDRLTREELWNSNGGYVRTDFTAEGGFSRKTYLDGQLRQTETANGTKFSRTVWQDNGTKLQQDFENGSLVLEREWKANGQFHKTTFSANGNRTRDTFVDGQLRVREQWVKNTFTRTAYDLEKGGTSERYVDNLLVQEQRWDALGNRVTVTYAPETGEKLREEVVAGNFKKVTVWNATRTTTVIYQKDVEISREIWQGDNYTRTITDGKGNTLQSVYVAGKLATVNQWDANGRRQRITYDTATGKQSQMQIWGTAGEYEITKWNEGVSTRRVYQDQQEVLREVRDGKTFVQTRWDLQGNVVKDTFVKDRLSTREFTDASGNRLRYTYAPATGERTKMEKWDTTGGYDVTTWTANGSKREVHQGKKLVMTEVVKGNTLTRTLYDAKGNWRQDVFTDGKLTLRIEQDNAGNSIRRTYSAETGKLTREDARNSTGGTRITTWNEEGQLQQTYQDGKLILREQWSGNSFVRTAWDGNGGTLREVFTAGRMTLREVTVGGTTQRTTYFEAPAPVVTGNWKGSTTKSAVPAVYIQETTEVLNGQGGRQVTHVYSDGTQSRHHYQGSEEQLRQTWDAAGVMTSESWGAGKATVEKAVISALNAVLKGFQKSKQGYALVGLQSGFPKSVVTVSQPGKIVVNAKNVAVAKGVQMRSTDKLEAAVQKAQESFVNPRKFGKTFNALTKGINTTDYQRTQWQDNGDKIVSTYVKDELKSREIVLANGNRLETVHDADGKTTQSVHVDGKLATTIITTGDQTIRTAHQEDGNKYQQTLVGEKLVREESWTNENTYQETTYLDNGTIVRSTYRDGRQIAREELAGTRRTETYWDPSGDVFRQIFESDKLIQQEIWKSDGTYQRNIWQANGTATIEYFENGQLRQKTEQTANSLIRTGWGEDGTVLRQTWVNGRQTLEEAWDASGGHRKTSWFEDGRVLRQTWQNGSERLREEWSGKNFTRIGWDGEGNSYRQTFESGLQVKEERWSKSGDYQVTEWKTGVTTRNTYSNGKHVQREEWTGNKYDRTSWDGNGNSMKETFVDGKIVTIEQWASSGASIRKTYNTAGKQTKEEKWGTNGESQVTNWYETSTWRQSYLNGKEVLREVWSGSDFTKTAWDGKGNSLRETYSSGKLVRDEKWSADGAYQITEWTSTTTTRRTYQNGKEVLRETWQGTSYVKVAWDASKNSMRQTYENGKLLTSEYWSSDGSILKNTYDTNGKQIREEIWDGSGTVYRRTNWYSDGSVWRQYFMGGKEVYRQVWDSSGYREWQWDPPAGFGLTGGLGGLQKGAEDLGKTLGSGLKNTGDKATQVVTNVTNTVKSLPGEVTQLSEKIVSIKDLTNNINASIAKIDLSSLEKLANIGAAWKDVNKLFDTSFGKIDFGKWGGFEQIKTLDFGKISVSFSMDFKFVTNLGADLDKWKNDRFEVAKDYSADRWQAATGYGKEKLESGLDYLGERMAAGGKYLDDRFQAGIDYFTERGEAWKEWGQELGKEIAGGIAYYGGKIEDWFEHVGGWDILDGTDWNATPQSEVYKIELQRLNPGSSIKDQLYRVTAHISDATKKFHEVGRVRVKVVDQAGSTVVEKTIDVKLSDWNDRHAVNIDFNFSQSGAYKIVVMLKEHADDNWYELAESTEYVVLPLNTSERLTVFYDQANDPDYRPKTTAGSNTQNTNITSLNMGNGSFGFVQVTAATEREAEEQRGFGLDYVVANVDVYQSEEGRFVAGFDTVQVTRETQIEVVVEEVDASGRSLAEIAMEKAEAAYNRQRDYLTDLSEAYTRFEQDFAKHYGNLNDVMREEYARYVAWWKEYESSGDLPQGEKFFQSAEEFWYGEPSEVYDRNGQSYWTEFLWSTSSSVYKGFGEFPKNSLGTSQASWWSGASLKQAANAGKQLENLRKDAFYHGIPAVMKITLTGDQIARGADVTDIVNNANNGRHYQVKISETGGKADPQKQEVSTFTLNLKALEGLNKALQEGRKKLEPLIRLYQEKREADMAANLDRIRREVSALAGMKGAMEEAFNTGDTLLQMAIPAYGFMVSGENVYAYATEGNVGGVLSEGAFMLLDILGLGATAKGLGKLGSVTKFGAKNTEVVKLETVFAKAGGRLDGLSEASIQALKQFALKSKDYGMAPAHALSLGSYAKKSETLIIVRASNAASLKYHGKPGYAPKPGNAPTGKTDSTGLLKANLNSSGVLLDAEGKASEYMVKEINGKKVIMKWDRVWDEVKKEYKWDTAKNDYLMDFVETKFTLGADNYILDAKSNRMFSDYDMLGAYQKETYQKNGMDVWSQRATGDKQSTSPWVANLNKSVTPDQAMFMHGANDDFWKHFNGKVFSGNPDVGWKFIVADVTGEVRFMNLAEVIDLYNARGLPVPF